MKQTIFTTATRLAIGVIAVLVIAGCDDGQITLGGMNLDVVPASPIIMTFQADPAEVNAGGSTTITWEVAGADRVEIIAISQGDPVDFHIDTSELSGSAEAAGLSATTDFILTASVASAEEGGEVELESAALALEGEDEGEEIPEGALTPDAGLSSVSQTITVTVIQSADIAVEFGADATELTAGQSQTVLRWSVTPTEGVDIAIVADTDEPIAGTDQCDGDTAAILAAGEVGNIPPMGCATVAPDGRTTYTITVTDQSDPTNTKSVDLVIDVARITLEVESFTVDKPIVLNNDTAVTLQFMVTPADAQIVIDVDGDVQGCVLPTDESPIASTGALQRIENCYPQGKLTTFTLIASLGEASDTAVATITQQNAGAAGIKIVSDGWAFAGEEVTVELQALNNPQVITKIVISDAGQDSGQVVLSGFGGETTIRKKVRVPRKTGVQVKWRTEGTDVDQSVLAVQALASTPKVLRDPNGGASLPITRIEPAAASQGNLLLYGVQRGGYSDGTALLFQSDSVHLESDQMHQVAFGPAMLAHRNLAGYINGTFLEKMSYPVSAIAADKSDRTYMGTAGAIMYSDDGASWSLFESFPIRANKDHPYSGSHNTCRGEVQHGTKYSGKDWKLVSMMGVCDILTFDDGRLIAAIDNGAFMLPSADAHMSKPEENPWQNIPPKGQTRDAGAAYMMYGRLVNDLEYVASANKVFAAAAHGYGTAEGGVFVSSDKGATWSECGLKDTDVYTINYDLQAKKVYAGTADGVYVTSVDSCSFAAVGSLGAPVFALGVDPYSAGGGVLVAGTDDGVAILRGIDAGGAWVGLDNGTGGSLGKVQALNLTSTVKAEANAVQHVVAVGTAKGAIGGDVVVDIAGVIEVGSDEDAPADEPAEEDVAEEDETPTDDEETT